MAHDKGNDGSAAAADAKGATKKCVVCGSEVQKPYITLLGGGVICSIECYQRHLNGPDDDEKKSDSYW